MEHEDSFYIRKSSEAIRRGELDDVDTTTLLMLNRLFTQSCRMIILSLHELLSRDDNNDDPQGSSPINSQKMLVESS
ncbi:MAG: hypothetical protein U5K69_18495 [Balneolaceae bacterium]|nr:hypothetical protein [Balneolaceae bacterium]